MGIVVLIITIAIIIIVIQEYNQNKRITNENLYAIETYDYCGGNDYIATDTKVELKWSRDNFLTISFLNAGRIETVPFYNVNRVYAKTEHQIREDVTLTRLAVMGIFAFGNKKEVESNRHYLVLSYQNIEDQEQNLILSSGTNLQNEINLYCKILKDYEMS